MKTFKRKRKLKKKSNKTIKELSHQQLKVIKAYELETKINTLTSLLKNTKLKYNDLEKLRENINEIRNYIDLSKIEDSIKNIFEAFNLNKSGDLDLIFLKDCMHALGLCFNESAFKSVCALLIPESLMPMVKNVKKMPSYRNLNIVDAEKTIKFNDFSDTMLAFLLTGLYNPKTEENLLEAFECVSQYLGKNFTEWNDFESIIVISNEKFNYDEIQAMKTFLSIDDTKTSVSYREYVKLLADDQNKFRIKFKISEKNDSVGDIIERFGY
jgi:hypothetical protein